MGPADHQPETTPRWNEAVRSRAPLYLIVAFLLALLAGVLTFLYLDQIREQSLPTSEAVVALRELRPGAVITSDVVEVRAVPEAALPDGAIRNLREAVGRMAIYPVANGEVVLQRDLVGEDEGGLAARLPDGRWAMVMPVGWLVSPLPEVGVGDRVDVLAYSGGQLAEQAGLIVEGVELFSTSENFVTLAVTIEEATSILYAHVNGFQMLGLVRAQGG
ncbi:MAG: Flp pilus assembly protein CpaB [Anaerolineales bacterium]